MRLVFDIEGDGLLNTIENIWCIATQEPDTGEKNFYGHDTLDEGIVALRDAECLIGHNIIGYDLPAIWKVLGEWDNLPSLKLIDTLIVSRALEPERKGGHSLAAWGETLGFPKGDHTDWTQYSEEMKKYCVRDVSLNVQVFKQLDKEVEDKYGTTMPGYKVYS